MAIEGLPLNNDFDLHAAFATVIWEIRHDRESRGRVILADLRKHFESLPPDQSPVARMIHERTIGAYSVLEARVQARHATVVREWVPRAIVFLFEVLAMIELFAFAAYRVKEGVLPITSLLT